MAGMGRIYRRGHIYYIAYRWDGREYRESARSSQRGVAERLLATRLRERRGSPPPAALTFDALAAWYLDDYGVRRLRTLDTARGRVANLRAVFGGWPATAITTEAIRSYQRRRRTAGAAAATVNRETSALSRMFQLAVRSRQLPERPVFPERLEENGPRPTDTVAPGRGGGRLSARPPGACGARPGRREARGGRAEGEWRATTPPATSSGRCRTRCWPAISTPAASSPTSTLPRCPSPNPTRCGRPG